MLACAGGWDGAVSEDDEVGSSSSSPSAGAIVTMPYLLRTAADLRSPTTCGRRWDGAASRARRLHRGCCERLRGLGASEAP